MSGIKKEKIRKVFLDDLPIWESGIGSGRGTEGTINWIRCAELRCKVRFIYDNLEGYVEIIGYEGKHLYIKYLDNNIFKIQASNFQKCQLGKVLGKITKEFKVEIGTHYEDNKRDLIIIDREYRKNKRNQNKKHYRYKCNKCGYYDWIEEGNLFQGKGCSVCCESPVTIIENINSIVATAPWMIKFFANPDDAKLYTKSSNKSVEVKCPNCGIIKQYKVSDLYRNKSICCPNCGDGFSYGHKYVHNLLTQLGLDFIDNQTLDWCKFYNPYKDKEVTGEYDFIIEDIKVIVEVDGGFHKNDNKMNGQSKEESEFIDDMKDKLADEHGYKVIRIDYDDSNLNIKEGVFKSELNDIFDLSNINWLKCEEYALSSRIKEACILKQYNPDYTTRDISKIMNIDQHTVINYLKKGSKVWDWINYDTKEEIEKKNIRSKKANKEKFSKKVEIFKDGQSLGVFESAKELEIQSEELFGIKLHRSKISAVCLEKRPHHKHYTFKFVS